jgi:hypothetical protein
LLTVGYGDVNPATSAERLLYIFLMFAGVIVFGFFQGTLTSLIQTLDEMDAA